ncbi:MAG: T9SS type A sorting domain-containing protein [Chlorobi bacterium]|nr:T9SS type A sorting domain-containing protein [Chlorobiota bacterium]
MGNCVVPNRQLRIPNSRINTSKLKNGVYFYSIYDSGIIIQIGKLIKNR